MIEKKVYNGWAFTENEKEKGKINREIYKELKKMPRLVKQYIKF